MRSSVLTTSLRRLTRRRHLLAARRLNSDPPDSDPAMASTCWTSPDHALWALVVDAEELGRYGGAIRDDNWCPVCGGAGREGQAHVGEVGVQHEVSDGVCAAPEPALACVRA